MCFQDWRIGRLIRAVPFAYTVAAAATKAILASQQRVAITFFQNQSSEAWTIKVGSCVIAMGGATNTYQGDPIHIAMNTHGDLSTQSFLITGGGPTSLVYSGVEYFAPEWLITADPEKLKAMLDSYRG